MTMRGLAGRSEEATCGGEATVDSLILRSAAGDCGGVSDARICARGFRPSTRSGRFRGCCGGALYLRAQLNKLEQHFVSLSRQFVNRARTDLGAHAVNQLLLHCGRQHRLPENLPPRCHRTGELREEVLDAALAAAEMIEKEAPHDAPPQARAP